MSQGLQIFNSGGQLMFDATARLGRLIYVGRWNASPYARGTWYQVMPSSYQGTVWGAILPTMAIDSSLGSQLYIDTGTVQIDPVSRPGQIMTLGNDTIYANSILMIGVY